MVCLLLALGVWGLGFRVFGVTGGLRVWGLVFRGYGGFEGLGFRGFEGLGFGVLRFRR